MKSFYPAGDEQVIVAEVTQQVIPPAGIPLDVGCVVSNVGTMYNIALALEGKNVTHKYLTVSGMVKKPTVICVPLGTSFAQCLELAGGIPEGDWMAIAGGPMMGRRLTRDQALEASVIKTTSGILILPIDSLPARKEQITLLHMYQRARSSYPVPPVYGFMSPASSGTSAGTASDYAPDGDAGIGWKHNGQPHPEKCGIMLRMWHLRNVCLSDAVTAPAGQRDA